LRRKSGDCDEIAVPQRFPRNYGNRSAQNGVFDREQVTMQQFAIKILFSLMVAGKIPSQMNPLAQNNCKAMLAKFRSVEIQA
jgi:hypothetical protein